MEAQQATKFEKKTGPLGSKEVSTVSDIEGDFVVMTDESPAYKVNINSIEENQNWNLYDDEGNQLA